MIIIDLPAEIEARLESLAESAGQTKSDFILQAVLEYLEDMEDEREVRG